MVVVLMGGLGAGRSPLGRLPADKLKWRFADADDFHPSSNVEKMRHGIPLDDQDRVPWLSALREAIEEWNANTENVVLACSALRQKYRAKLGTDNVQFVYLKGSRELILGRLRARHGHFASESILDSQCADLEAPHDAVTIAVVNSPETIVGAIIANLKLSQVAYPVPHK